jgi:hypothetical protein
MLELRGTPEEQRRHECECREWIKRRAAMGPQDGKTWLAQVMRDIEKRRGKVAAERLRNDIVGQWKAGNRGEYGDWRE